LGRLEVGWKSGVLEHKGVSLKRVRIQEVIMEGLQEVTNALSNGTIRDPL